MAGLGLALWLVVRLAPREAVIEHLDALEKPGLWARLRGKKA